MAINPIQLKYENNRPQPSFRQEKAVSPYLAKEGAVSTTNNVRPLPPEGHLVNDGFLSGIKYFFKDRAYDIKAVKDGFNGDANDHQLGRLNDVGLVLGGIGIAAYLASKTTNPRVRIMEYLGLGSFLTAMSLYPKIAINTPAKLLHGYDIDKEYIDDQGRKKSVQQDSNYVPYDMYLGDTPDEDINIIADKMGIPRDIKNRNDVAREQMRKVATQNNTLWTTTAWITPAIGGLLCCGLENFVVSPALEKYRNAKYSSKIAEMLSLTSNMNLDVKNVENNALGSKVNRFLNNYKGQDLLKEEFEILYQTIAEGVDSNLAEGIKKDLLKILKNSNAGGGNAVVISSEVLDNIIIKAKNTISKNNKDLVEQVLVPSREELEALVKKVVPDIDLTKRSSVSHEDAMKIKDEIRNLLDSKIENANISENIKGFLELSRNRIVNEVSGAYETNVSLKITDDVINKVSDFAKVIGEFMDNKLVLDKCKSFKFEYAPETVLARSYSKFENTLLKQLGIGYKDLKKMRDSETYAKEILDNKLSELVKNEKRYKQTLEKLGNVIAEMEVKLDGKGESESQIKDLITAIENNYNNTAKRLSGIGSFNETIDRLVKEDVKTLSNSIKSKAQLFDFMDGLIAAEKIDVNWGNNLPVEKRIEILLSSAKGVGSSKDLDITRMLERYQGAKNSFYRIMHTLDVYNRAQVPGDFANSLKGKKANYINSIIEFAKNNLLSATTSDHVLKLDTVNNPIYYKDYMNAVYQFEDAAKDSITAKGFITEATKDALGKNGDIANGNVLERFQRYIARFKNIVANCDIDFVKKDHIINQAQRSEYTPIEKTRMAFFNLIGQSPVDMLKGAAGRKYNTQRWVRVVSGITAGVFGGVLLAQFGFGKLRNPQNLQKKVQDVTNK